MFLGGGTFQGVLGLEDFMWPDLGQAQGLVRFFSVWCSLVTLLLQPHLSRYWEQPAQPLKNGLERSLGMEPGHWSSSGWRVGELSSLQELV